MGAQIEARADGFCVTGPTPLHGAIVDSHGDHRLGMALAVAGLLAEGETVVRGRRLYRGFVSRVWRATGLNSIVTTDE